MVRPGWAALSLSIAAWCGATVHSLDIVVGCKITCNDTSESPVPVCGSDGVTYGSMCLFLAMQCRNSTIAKAYDGKCMTETQQAPTSDATPSNGGSATTKNVFCNWPCNDAHKEMCGDNNVTYRNPCHFSVAQCESPTLKMSYPGTCFVTLPPRPSFCDEESDCSSAQIKYVPTCGSDGITYKNDCQFKLAFCVNNSLSVAYAGPCIST